jgi:hypothetical protein
MTSNSHTVHSHKEQQSSSLDYNYQHKQGIKTRDYAYPVFHALAFGVHVADAERAVAKERRRRMLATAVL